MPRYILFNKPFGVLSQFTGEPGQRTLSEFSLPAHVYAAGRLDKDSEGLLLLSDDGPFIKRFLDPANNHERKYWAEVEGVPTRDAIEKLSHGVEFKGYLSKPCRARIVEPQPIVAKRDPPVRFRKSIPTCWIELVLTEGKNRQVRRMTATVGFPTLRLIRKRIGKLSLGDLAPGDWREIQKSDIF
ncbi:MAG: pseudouridine synthase [Sneathiella sp.]|uniref:pseudouridine synthase n=1 Tax=Sneathiella sp. TaxID=1964365 RepID=UPI000C6ABFA2|nr:pseudouridine synthase [Sneathiella sp.]MAZ01996.1 pseudouridine synthase [Sneathiella sp.]|tara:strand:- start:361 stop:915 length:555 start_codon:yes stop_codon:yes gene_type:complete